MESIFLNIEAVNTHRERPQVKRGFPPMFPPQKKPHWGTPKKQGWQGEALDFGEPSHPLHVFTLQNVDISRPPADALVTVPYHY